MKNDLLRKVENSYNEAIAVYTVIDMESKPGEELVGVASSSENSAPKPSKAETDFIVMVHNSEVVLPTLNNISETDSQVKEDGTKEKSMAEDEKPSKDLKEKEEENGEKETEEPPLSLNDADVKPVRVIGGTSIL